MSNKIPGSCPEPDELGRAGWNILHTAAAVYPNKPSSVQQEGMRKFIEGWSQVYACSHCAYHMRQHVAKHPPVLKDKREASWYVCDMHNKVNKILDKEQFDCDPDVVLKRWHPSYPEMEDTPTIEEQIAQIRKEEAMKKNGGGVTPPSASANSEKSGSGGGGGFFAWFGGGKKKTAEATPPPPPPQQQHQQPPQQHIAGRNVPAGGISRVAEHELNADPRVQTRWGNDPVFDQEKPRQGAVRSGWNSSTSYEETSYKSDPFRSTVAGTVLPSNNTSTAGVVKGLSEAASVGSTVPPTTDASEADISEIMKKVRACAVYCPEKDKNKTPGLGHL